MGYSLAWPGPLRAGAYRLETISDVLIRFISGCVYFADWTMTCGLDGNILRTEYNKSRDSPSALRGVSGSNPAVHRENYVSRSHLGT